MRRHHNAVAALAVLALPSLTFGQCYRPTYYPSYVPPYVTNTVVVREVVHDPVFYAVPTFVPLYSTGYIPPQPVPPAQPAVAPAQQRAAAPADDKLDRILAAVTAQGADLRSLSSRVDALERGGRVAPEPVPPPEAPAAAAPKDRKAAGLAVLHNRCAGCHTEGRLFAKDSPGGKRQAALALFGAGGAPAKLTAANKADVGKRARQQTMPLDPGDLHAVGLPDDEYADLQDYLDSL